MSDPPLDRLVPVTDAAGGRKRDRLVAAFIRLTAAGGYEGLTPAAIAAEAGLGEGDFERHFSSREDCLDRVWDEMTCDLISRIYSAYVNESTWREGLRAAAYLTLRYFTEDEVRARFFIVEVLSTGEMAKLRRDQLFQAAVELVDLGRFELADPGSVPRSTAEIVLGGIYERINIGIRGEGLGGEAGVEGVRELMYLAVRPYLGHEAAREELTIPPPRGAIES